MAFHTELFPVEISYGSKGGPGYKTSIQTTDSGQEHRISQWDNPRYQFDASYGVKSYDDLYLVQKFYHARKGALHGFLFKDHLDFSTEATGRGTAAFDDCLLGTFGTATSTIQLRKSYQFEVGGATSYRTITRPIASTIKVGWDSNGDGTVTEQASGWTCDSAGVVSITSATANSKAIYAGCQFYVPVRFGEGADKILQANLESFDVGNMGSIPIIEIKDSNATTEDFFYGGSKTYTADASHGFADGRVVWTAQSSGNISITLPDLVTGSNGDNYAPGGPYFYFLHTGTGGNLYIKSAQGATYATLTTLTGAVVHCLVDGSGTRTWGVWA